MFQTSTVLRSPPVAAQSLHDEAITLETFAPTRDSVNVAPCATTCGPAEAAEHQPADASAQPQAPKRSATATALIMAPLCLSVTLSALDLTISTPAIPAIVSNFSSVAGYIWVGGAFVLATTAITPVWGSVADIWGRKPVMTTAVATFLGGSLLCAVAQSMNALIAGRVVQGLGASGMGTMVNVIICDSFSLRDRGLYLAITSVVWAIASAVGPVIGGVFTTKLDWRWCFWFNLPIGAVVFIVLIIYLKVPSPGTPVLAGIKAIDWTGSFLIVGGTLMVLLALDFGDVTYPWSSATVISLLVFGMVVIGLFILVEWKHATNPVVPLRLFSTLSSTAPYVVFACNSFVLAGFAYYLPLYSQSVLGADALESGVHLLPIIVSCSLAAAFAGVFIQQTGIYLPLMYVSQGLVALGTGLFLNLGFGESLAKLFTFQIITGIGIGMNIEPPVLAAQAATTVRDTAVVIATMGFLRSIANAISIVIGGVVFQNEMNAAYPQLLNALGEEVAGHFKGDQAAANVEFIGTLSAVQQVIVRQAYFEAFKKMWILYVAFAGLSLVMNLFVRGHHLSSETKTAVLGVKRQTAGTSEQNTILTLPTGVSVGVVHREETRIP